MKNIKINKSLLVTSLVLALTSCVLTGERSALREPAQVSDAQKFQSPGVQKEINPDELLWIDMKTPNVKSGTGSKKTEKIIVFDKSLEKTYQSFISTFGLSDTLEVRSRFFVSPVRPFSDVELNYLENLPVYKSRMAAANKKTKAQATANQRRDLFKRSQAKPTTTAAGTRVAVTRGKPSWVDTTYWIAADVATVLQKQGINFEDTVFYFKTFGFRSLVNGKKIHISDLYLRYRDYGSKGSDFVQLSAAEIERIKTFSGILSGERSKILVDMIKRGSIVDEKLEKVLIANGFGPDEIAAAKDENNLVYKEAYRQGKAFNNIYEKHILTMPSTLARIQAEKDMGYISEADYRTRFNREKQLADQFKAETEAGWSASLANIGTNLLNNAGPAAVSLSYGGVFTPIYIDNRQQYAKDELDRIIKTYGSAVDYYKFLADVEEKYKFRPNARSVERMFRFFEGIPRTIGNTIAFIDVAREIIPVPTNGYDFYKMVTGQKIVAKDGYFYQANEAIHDFVKNSRPENKDFDEEFWVAVAPQVISQMTVQIGAGLLTGGSSAIIGTATSVGFGVAQSGTETYKAAAEANASEQHRIIAARVGALTGLIDILPMGKFFGAIKTPALKATMWKTFVGTMFKGFEKQVGSKAALEITKGVVARQMFQYGSKILVGQITEGMTEVTQKKINDFAAKMTYDPQRNVLSFSAADMQDFWGGVVGGTFGGGFEIALSSASNVQSAAIENEVAQVASLFAMIKYQDKATAQLAVSETDKLFVPLMMLDKQIETTAKSTRTDMAFLKYKEQLINQHNAIMSRAQASNAMSAEMKRYVETKQKENQTALVSVRKEITDFNAKNKVDTTSAPVTTAAASQSGNIDYVLNQNNIDAGLISTLKQKANEVIWNKIVNDKAYADALIEVLHGHPHLQKNVVTFLVPADSRRRTFFNQMMQKVVDSKVTFIRQQMVENTRRVLEQPDCGM